MAAMIVTNDASLYEKLVYCEITVRSRSISTGRLEAISGWMQYRRRCFW